MVGYPEGAQINICLSGTLHFTRVEHIRSFDELMRQWAPWLPNPSQPVILISGRNLGILTRNFLTLPSVQLTCLEKYLVQGY